MHVCCMGFYEELIQTLNASLNEDFEGKTSRMGKACDVHPTTLKRLLDGERSKWAQMLGRIADAARVTVCRGKASPVEERPLVSPEAIRVDEVITAMRKAGMVPEAIRDGAVRELAAMFEKKIDEEQPKQTRRAS